MRRGGVTLTARFAILAPPAAAGRALRRWRTVAGEGDRRMTADRFNAAHEQRHTRRRGTSGSPRIPSRASRTARRRSAGAPPTRCSAARSSARRRTATSATSSARTAAATASTARSRSRRASLTRGHRADLTNTSPTDSVGPYPQWAQGDRIVSMDPCGAVVADVSRRSSPTATTSARRSRSPRRTSTCPRCASAIAAGPARGRRPHPARQRLGDRHQGGDRAGVVAARRRGALQVQRDRPAPRAVRGDGRHVPRARHARRPRGVPAADRRADGLRVRRPARISPIPP